MSRYTYEGRFQNPANDYFVKRVDNQDTVDHDVAEKWQIWVRTSRPCDCGQNCNGTITEDRPSNPLKEFDNEEHAYEYIEGVEEFFEEDYDNYLEENSFEIARMERYEAWRNEY